MPMPPQVKAKLERQRAEDEHNRRVRQERAQRQAANRPPPGPEPTHVREAREMAERHRAELAGEAHGPEPSPAFRRNPHAERDARIEQEKAAEAERARKILAERREAEAQAEAEAKRLEAQAEAERQQREEAKRAFDEAEQRRLARIQAQELARALRGE